MEGVLREQVLILSDDFKSHFPYCFYDTTFIFVKRCIFYEFTNLMMSPKGKKLGYGLLIINEKKIKLVKEETNI